MANPGGSAVTFDVAGQQVLRTALLAEKVELYSGLSKLTNCGGIGQCGTCVVDVVSGDTGALSDRSDTELRKLKNKPMSYRLACQTVTLGGEITIRARPS